ncbi:MAG: tetratricopeptide repeat protein, partial [Gemmataceae bacterium]|nr:tetratricopeptide repeat protein [Gemmataceae bacterium]
ADPAAAARLDWNLSAAHQAAGDPAAALARVEAFLKLKPVAVEPYERYAALLRQTGRGADVAPRLRASADRDGKNLPLQAVLAAELAREPDTRAEGDLAFARLAAATADPKVVRVAVRSHVETGRATLILSDLDTAYRVIHPQPDAPPGEPPPAGDKEFAADRARAVGDALRAEPGWANAALRAAADDLRAGTKHERATWHVLGDLAARNGKLDLAAVQYRQAIRTAAGPQAAREPYLRLVDTLHRLRRPAEIAEVCRDGLRNPPDIGPVYFHYYLAQALAELGEADEALAAADKAIAQAGDTDRPATQLGKVRALTALGRHDAAVSLNRRVLAEADTPADRARARSALATALWAAGRRDEAEAELRALLDADPDDAQANNDLGYHLAEQGRDLAEAERLVRHALAVDRADRHKAGSPEPESHYYLDSLGWVLFRRGNLPAARAALERAAALPDGTPDGVVWDHLGDVLFRLGEKGKAKAAWEKAAGLYATDPRARRDGRADSLANKLRLLAK